MYTAYSKALLLPSSQGRSGLSEDPKSLESRASPQHRRRTEEKDQRKTESLKSVIPAVISTSRHYLVTKDSSLSRQFWFERQVEARCHSCFSSFLDVPNWQITKLLKRAILKVRLPVTGALNVFLIRWWFKTFQTSYRARASCLCRVRMALPRMSCRQNVVFYREPRLPCKQMGVVCPR